MRWIPLLAVDAVVVFDGIAAAKSPFRRTAMSSARQQVLASYQDYENAVPEVGALVAASLTDLQKDAMQHAYSVETQPMTALRGELLKRTEVASCPFCGINESSTLDHYLPKERYPEFSVFPKNLVPSCAVCNTRKRDRIFQKGTDIRMFLHPCFDQIPDVEFLTVRTRMEADALVLSYRLTRPKGMALRTFRHLRSHFDELGLADRYRRMGLEHLGSQYHSLQWAYGAGKDAARVAEQLLVAAKGHEARYGPNFWLAKLYEALANNKDFCDGGFEVIRGRRQPPPLGPHDGGAGNRALGTAAVRG